MNCEYKSDSSALRYTESFKSVYNALKKISIEIEDNLPKDISLLRMDEKRVFFECPFGNTFELRIENICFIDNTNSNVSTLYRLPKIEKGIVYSFSVWDIQGECGMGYYNQTILFEDDIFIKLCNIFNKCFKEAFVDLVFKKGGKIISKDTDLKARVVSIEGV